MMTAHYVIKSIWNWNDQSLFIINVYVEFSF